MIPIQIFLIVSPYTVMLPLLSFGRILSRLTVLLLCVQPVGEIARIESNLHFRPSRYSDSFCTRRYVLFVIVACKIVRGGNVSVCPLGRG